MRRADGSDWLFRVWVLKEELRKEAQKKRDKIIDPAKALLLRDNFLKNIEIPPASIIACYWPIGSEIDVRPLITALYNEGHYICLPCMEPVAASLTFRQWEPGAVLVKNKFKIHEPCRQNHDEALPSVLITPLLAFDKSKHRLGYGGGYYDRTIKKFRDEGLPLLAMGIGYAAQEIEKIPAGEFDVQLDKIVTESKVF